MHLNSSHGVFLINADGKEQKLNAQYPMQGVWVTPSSLIQIQTGLIRYGSVSYRSVMIKRLDPYLIRVTPVLPGQASGSPSNRWGVIRTEGFESKGTTDIWKEVQGGECEPHVSRSMWKDRKAWRGEKKASAIIVCCTAALPFCVILANGGVSVVQLSTWSGTWQGSRFVD